MNTKQCLSFNLQSAIFNLESPSGRYLPQGTDSVRILAAQRGVAVRQELNILALLKGEERYVFVYDDESRQLLIDTFRDQAAEPRLSLSWFDAAVLTQKAWEQAGAGSRVLPSSRPRI